jgi:hypothetical protein
VNTAPESAEKLASHRGQRIDHEWFLREYPEAENTYLHWYVNYLKTAAETNKATIENMICGMAAYVDRVRK